MKYSPRILLVSAILFTVARCEIFAGHYVPSASIELTQVLGNPPSDSETAREVEIVLREQNRRQPSDIARAKTETAFNGTIFAEIIGPKFNEANLPLTFALLKNAEADARDFSEDAKKIWNRPRPPLADKRVTPAVDLPANGSYPSGHATRGHLFALVLGEIFPEKRGALLARGWLVGWDRVIGGVHFPSDVAAGHKLADYIGLQMLNDPTFKADVAKAREECIRVFGSDLLPLPKAG